MKYPPQSVLLILIGSVLAISIFIDSLDGVFYAFDKTNSESNLPWIQALDIENGKLRYFLYLGGMLGLALTFVSCGILIAKDSNNK